MFKIAALVALCVGSASATIVYTATGNETGGNPIHAEAIFSFGSGTLTITLKNLEAGNTTVAQNISDLEFALSVGGTTNYTGSSATTIDCSTGTCIPNATPIATGWGFGTDGGNLIICIICPGSATLTVAQSGQPSHTIIGPSPVAAGSILTGSHNPFLDQVATFTFTNSLFTANTTLSSVIFSFGTAAGDNVPGTFQSPEPLSLLLTGAGLAAVGLLRRRLRS